MHHRPQRPLLLVLALVLAWLAPPAAAQDGRVIVLGFDGADARTTQKMIDAGELPNLARLAADGTFEPLVSTNPAESAAGWAAINTGLSPAQNGIPSFVMRNVDEDLGMVLPGNGYTGIETLPIEDLGQGGLLGILAGYDGMVVAGAFGGVVFLAFLIVFAGLLRVKKGLALALSLVLAGVGGWGALQARGYVPAEVPGVITNRLRADVDNFWETAAKGGVESIVLDAALSFGRPDQENMRVLAGLGLPDLRGGQNGEWFIYTDDEFEMDRPPSGAVTGSGGGTKFRIDERDGQYTTEIFGPENFYHDQVAKERIAELEAKQTGAGWKEAQALRDEQDELEDSLGQRATVPMVITKQEGSARITIGSQSQVVKEGEWSDWYRMTFQMNPLVKASAVTRVKVMSLEEPFELFVNNLEIDPAAPAFWQPISMPNDFAAELADWIGGPYETTGWSCMTNQLKDKVLDVETFLEDIEFTMKWREKATYAALERRDWRLLFSVFSTTDRTQHMMYKYYDDQHPLYDAEEAAREVTFFGERVALKDVIPAIYKQMDRIVGEVRQRFLSDDDVLMLCADHGFTSYRRGVNINNWLVEEGYLILQEGISRSDGGFLGNFVDWERTRAYSLGLGMVFLNLEGREPEGIVKKSEADALMAEISAAFLRYEDPETGLKVGQDAVIMKDIYPGPWGTTDFECADIMFGFAENYRVEWNNVLGKITLVTEDGAGVPGDTVKDNKNNWSGDHASNSPHLVTGIFFSSVPVQVPEDGVSVMHIAPTVLERLGVERPAPLHEPLARK